MGSFIKSTGTGISSTLDFVGNQQNIASNREGMAKEREYAAQGIKELNTGADRAVAAYQPYQDIAPRSLAEMQSAVYGGEVNGHTWKPQESEGFKFTKARSLEDLGRSLRMMGRGSGTVAANSTGRTIGELNANNENAQFDRLKGLVGLGQYGTDGVANTQQNRGRSLSDLYMTLGGRQAAGYRNLGLAKKQLWSDQAKWNYQGASDAGDGFNEYMGGGKGGGGMGGMMGGMGGGA